MRTLIFGCVFIDGRGHWGQDNLRLFNVWRRLIRTLNPDCDLLVVDSGSPVMPPAHIGDINLRFPDHLGHFYHDRFNDPPPRDGPGRAIMSALSLAMNLDYDRAAYIECDCLFIHPVSWAFDQMTRKYACGQRTTHGYLDNNVAFFSDLKWLREFDFVGKYDWTQRVGDQRGEPAGEYIWENLFGEHLEVLPIRGGRMQSMGINASNFRRAFPQGCDYVTHADKATNEVFLRQNGFIDLVEHL